MLRAEHFVSSSFRYVHTPKLLLHSLSHVESTFQTRRQCSFVNLCVLMTTSGHIYRVVGNRVLLPRPSMSGFCRGMAGFEIAYICYCYTQNATGEHDRNRYLMAAADYSHLPPVAEPSFDQQPPASSTHHVYGYFSPLHKFMVFFNGGIASFKREVCVYRY